MLDILEYSKWSRKFFNLLRESCSGFGETVPLNKWILSYEFKNMIVVWLDVLDLNFSHVENNYYIDITPNFNIIIHKI
jgi:hypothetical protein